MTKSIKDMAPEERGRNAPAGIFQRLMCMKHGENERPHIDRNGNISLRPIQAYIPI